MAIQQMKNNYCKGNPGVLLVLLLVGDVSLAGVCSRVTGHMGRGVPRLTLAKLCNAKLTKDSFVFKSFLTACDLFSQYLPQASSVSGCCSCKLSYHVSFFQRV